MTNELSWSNKGVALADIPEEWRPKYIIKRINGDDIEITISQRNNILEAISSGTRYIQIGEITLMINSINSIDPKWGQTNIPPRPTSESHTEFDEKEGKAYLKKNDDKQKLWDKLFG